LQRALFLPAEFGQAAFEGFAIVAAVHRFTEFYPV
jgi:hypothetical protein